VRDTVRGRRTGNLARDVPPETDPGVLKAYGRGLAASPLFEGFSEEELLALIRGLRLLSCEPGDVVLTEGEEGESLFVLATGTVHVHVGTRAGRSVPLCTLEEGAFFGEIATLSGRPRSATVTAATGCELLELDKASLEAIIREHPRVREVLEEFYVARATHPGAAAIRGLPAESDPARP
jgi:CRP-like cAMP-binding protein